MRLDHGVKSGSARLIRIKDVLEQRQNAFLAKQWSLWLRDTVDFEKSLEPFKKPIQPPKPQASILYLSARRPLLEQLIIYKRLTRRKLIKWFQSKLTSVVN